MRAGAKQSHWMWFIFPQIARLGRSEMARYYALTDGDEAEAYAKHPLLGRRLLDCVGATQAWAGKRTAEAIFGPIDALKLASSMTLFEACAAEPAPFAAALEAFNRGERDALTLARL